MVLGITAPVASAFTQTIDSAVISWDISSSICHNGNGLTPALGTQAWEKKSGRYIDFMRTYHVLQEFFGGDFHDVDSHSYYKRFPRDRVRYYSPGYLGHGAEHTWFYPLTRFGTGIYRVKVYFQWWYQGQIRAGHTLYTHFCNLLSL